MDEDLKLHNLTFLLCVHSSHSKLRARILRSKEVCGDITPSRKMLVFLSLNSFEDF